MKKGHKVSELGRQHMREGAKHRKPVSEKTREKLRYASAHQERWLRRGYLIGEKYCKLCDKIKPEIEFSKDKQNFDGLCGACRDCCKIYMKSYDSIPKNKKRRIEVDRKKYDIKKHIVFVHYSGNPPKCNCCGESIEKFLTVDHINNDGAEHRRKIKESKLNTDIYSWLIQNKFPDGFQILCYNCNLGRARSPNNICPHKQMLRE